MTELCNVKAYACIIFLLQSAKTIKFSLCVEPIINFYDVATTILKINLILMFQQHSHVRFICNNIPLKPFYWHKSLTK